MEKLKHLHASALRTRSIFVEVKKKKHEIMPRDRACRSLAGRASLSSVAQQLWGNIKMQNMKQEPAGI